MSMIRVTNYEDVMSLTRVSYMKVSCLESCFV